MLEVRFHKDDWVWLCEFLSQVLREGELDHYSKEDTQRILDTLLSAEKALYKA